MEAVLHSIAHPIALAIQAVAIAFVTAGSALALVKAARVARSSVTSSTARWSTRSGLCHGARPKSRVIGGEAHERSD
jgi:hypothetical protein